MNRSKREQARDNTLLLGLALAPWLAGSTAVWKGGVWLLTALLIAAVLLDLKTWKELLIGERPAMASWTKWPILAGLACLLWWFTQPLPDFASQFTENQIALLSSREHPIILQALPKTQHLVFLASLLLALPVVARAARPKRFLKYSAAILAANGFIISAYTLASAKLGAPPLPWIGTPESISRYSSPFFAYSGAATAVMISLIALWPLVPKTPNKKRRYKTIALCIGATLLAFAAFRHWPSSSVLVFTACLLLIYLLLQLPRPHFITGRWLQIGATGAILTIALSQFVIAHQVEKESGQNWRGVEATQLAMPARDKQLESQASTRGDRLIPSESANRPMVWMAGLRMSQNHPLIGEGPGSWTRTAALYSNDTLVNSFATCILFSHHDALQMTAEWGLLPGLALLSLWIAALWKQWGRIDNGRLEQAWALIILGLTLSSFMHWPLQIPGMQFWGLFIAGIGLSKR